MATTAADRFIDVAGLPGISRLFADYVSAPERLQERFPVGYRTADDWQIAAERAAGRTLDRDMLADILLEQNRRWGAPDAVVDHIESLRGDDAVVVVTGQQLGVFGGPLYTLYKTITAIRLADEMSVRLERPVVPVFWVEGEDHDFVEIASIHLLKQNDVVDLSLDASFEGTNPGAVGRLILGEGIERLIAAADETLPPSDFHDELIGTLRESYSPDRSLEDAFVHLWSRLFGERGLVFMNPDDRRFKQMVKPLFRQDLIDGETAVEEVMRAGRSLEGEYHMQVTARPTNLFYLDNSGRHAIDRADDVYRLRGLERSFTREEILDELDTSPEHFSPNVVTRPLMQDAILPTAYYVAGPGEIAYFAQYRGVYDWAGIPMPGIFPRMSATLVEPKIRKVVERHGLSLADLGDGVEATFGRLVREAAGNGASDAFDTFGGEIHSAVNRLKPEVESVDTSLSRSVEAMRAGIVKEVERLQERVFRSQKRQHDELRSQIEKAAANLVPNHKLQERVISPLYYFNKFGLGLVDRLFDDLDLDTTRHQLIDL